jgi:hypothetical protein
MLFSQQVGRPSLRPLAVEHLDEPMLASCPLAAAKEAPHVTCRGGVQRYDHDFFGVGTEMPGIFTLTAPK